jgi:regulator of cell morphogenesis and NO signaling
MAHECGCHHDAPVESRNTIAAVRPEETVGDVAHHRPGALEVMKAMGINHCCGAQLSLREAAAAAGVPLPALLSALNEPKPAPA